MVVGAQPDANLFGGGSAIYKTVDGGETWARVAGVLPAGEGFPISFAWYGSFAWDPVHDVYYVSTMSKPAFRLDCAP